MPAKTRFGLKGRIRDAYIELVLAFPLASIKSDEHLAEAQKGMWTGGPYLSDDGLHPNQAGNAELARAAAAALGRLSIPGPR